MAQNNGFDISRREILAGLGTIGVASAGAGLGTTAFFSDREDFEGNSLTAGELDLKVDWQEHYSDWSDDEADGIDTVAMEPADGLAGFPSAADETNQSVFVSDPDQFLRNTAIEAFPDITAEGEAYDALKEQLANDSDICDLPADTDEGDGVLSHSFRTRGTFPPDSDDGDLGNQQTTEEGDPLVQIEDVKPGDFGEVTFSFHLCGNPGYVWLTADLVSASENGYTEPEIKDPDESGEPGDDPANDTDVELLDEIRAAFWYDTGPDGSYGADFADEDDGEGDNYLQPGESPIQIGTLGSVLTALEQNPFPLDASPVSPDDGETGTGGGGDSTVPVVTDLDNLPDGGSLNQYTSTEDEPFKSYVANPGGNAPPSNLNCADYENVLGYDLVGTAVEAEGIEVGMSYSSMCRFTVTAYDQAGGTVELSSQDPVRVVGVKGGNEGEEIYEFSEPVLLDTVTFSTPTNQGVSNIDVCCPVDDNGNGVPPVGTPERECFPNSTTAYIGFEWWLPVNHANEIQTDSVSFDLGFYTEQCRHNDGSGQFQNN